MTTFEIKGSQSHIKNPISLQEKKILTNGTKNLFQKIIIPIKVAIGNKTIQE